MKNTAPKPVNKELAAASATSLVKLRSYLGVFTKDLPPEIIEE